MAPRLPTALWSQLGALPVLRSKTLVEDREAFGETRFRPRDISIDTSSGIATQLGTFWHEAVHVALWDSGVHNVLSAELEEVICDSIGTFLAGMHMAGCLTVRDPK